MALSNTDGRTKVTYVATISNIAAPSASTELSGGTALDGLITPDGLIGFEPDTGDVDTSVLNSTFSTVAKGRIAFSGTMLRLIKQTGTDTVYNLLVYGLAGYIVIRRDVTATTAYNNGDKVEVYPIQCGEVRDLAPAPNEVHKYEVPLGITTQPNKRATVAA